MKIGKFCIPCRMRWPRAVSPRHSALPLLLRFQWYPMRRRLCALVFELKPPNKVKGNVKCEIDIICICIGREREREEERWGGPLNPLSSVDLMLWKKDGGFELCICNSVVDVAAQRDWKRSWKGVSVIVRWFYYYYYGWLVLAPGTSLWLMSGNLFNFNVSFRGFLFSFSFSFFLFFFLRDG